MERELLFSITKDDFTFQNFRASGPGGQHRNKVETAVRCTHKASGAVGECVTHKSQRQNKIEAWKRCTRTEVFQKWYKLEVNRRMGVLDRINEEVSQMMQPHNLRIEKQENGKWVPFDS